MNKKTREEFIDLFAEGFEGVVAPEIDEIKQDMEKGFNKVDKKLKNVEDRLETMENRLDVVERKLDRVVDNHITHEGRIKKLESRQVLA